MKIQFEENDGLLQTDGLPRIVVVNVNGVKFPYQTDKTIVELYRDIEKIKDHSPVVSEVCPVEVRRDATGIIERGDIVHFTGPIDEQQSTDLFHNFEYRVMNLKGEVAEILNNVKPQDAIRLTVLKKDIVLIRKGLKPAVQKKPEFEQIGECVCGKEIVLKLNEKTDIYEGACDLCQNRMTLERGAKVVV